MPPGMRDTDLGSVDFEVAGHDGGGLDLSVVIPAFDEVRRLPQTVERIRSFLDAHPRIRSYEVVIVDDGSRDGTGGQFASDRSSQVRLLRNARNRGKGYSVRRGLAAAKGRHRLTTDCDLSTPIEDLDRMLDTLEREKCSVAIGLRYIPGKKEPLKQPFLRHLAGRTFVALARHLIGLHWKDTQCGFKLFTADAVADLVPLLSVDRFAWDVELLYLVDRMRLPIVEVPVRWEHGGHSKVKLFRDGAEMLMVLRRLHRRRVREAGGRSEVEEPRSNRRDGSTCERIENRGPASPGTRDAPQARQGPDVCHG